MKKLIVLVLCLCMVLYGCGLAPKETIAETTIEPETTESFMPTKEYLPLVSSCVESIYRNSAIIASVIRYQNTFWSSLEKLNGTVTSEKLIDSASKWLGEESNGEYSFEILADAHQSISDQYKDIIFANVDSPIAEVEESFGIMFDSYLGLYNMATNPSGSRQDFVNKADSYINNISEAKNKLDILLK